MESRTRAQERPRIPGSSAVVDPLVSNPLAECTPVARTSESRPKGSWRTVDGQLSGERFAVASCHFTANQVPHPFDEKPPSEERIVTVTPAGAFVTKSFAIVLPPFVLRSQ